MPTSPYDDTVVVLDFIGKVIYGRNATVLDVGSGFGRWGFLLRCHLANGRSLTVQSKQALRIDSIEASQGNITPLYQCVYDNTFKEDACAVLPTLSSYDVIIASHVIEHVSKDVGMKLLAQMVAQSRIATIVCLPFGERPQEAPWGDPYGLHRAIWQRSDFDQYEHYTWSNGHDGAVIIPVSQEAKWHVRMMNSFVRRLGFRVLGALKSLKKSHLQ